MTTTLETDLRRWAAPLLAEQELDLYDVELTGGVLKVVVDRTGGVGLDEIARFTRGLSHLLDEHDPISSNYTLEVSSPGIERRLRTAAHWRGAVGQPVKIKLRAGVAEDRRITGTVADATDDAATITTDGDATEVAYADIDSARTVFVWPGQPKPGKPPRGEAGQGAVPGQGGDPSDDHRRRPPVPDHEEGNEMTSGNSEMMEALQALATERGMSAETLMSALADALETAYKKMPGAHEFAWVTIDPDTFDIKVNAQEIDEEGNPFGPELHATPDNFGRIAAQTAARS